MPEAQTCAVIAKAAEKVPDAAGAVRCLIAIKLPALVRCGCLIRRAGFSRVKLKLQKTYFTEASRCCKRGSVSMVV